MYANDIFNIIDEMIPRKFALKNDKIGYFGKNFDNLDIKNIKIVMDLLPEDDLKFNKEDLVISHHPPLFMPKTPTYVVHSNWDIIGGGSNDALAYYLGLKPISIFHKQTGIGRICSSAKTLDEFLTLVSYKFGPENLRLVSDGNFNKILRKIAIVSGFGLSNKEFIKLAKDRSVDAFLSGDLNHSNAILARKLGLTLVDVSHHIIEIPGLFALKELIENNEKIDVPVELIDTGIPWRYISAEF
ncbi:Nif3-like dinuclear metal center hexameric protein [Methanobrevibacter olleyae]|uniref:Dinuclear metal center protein, YbgI/SA1388 family n=1 Tax=Methanobrevibacter olleyae TaxID=294671 RepID=A0A126QY71_METOL|nr:Nif3-like dinuclear metal center hexameric protein [Methanobrevibacter olleyae]AMK14757.1 NIF3 family protein HcgD [Methanobrevibacter olleyae]SFL47086.1 dinuclear metal center protein, YbgI/SA1388 family [Methanobrevibacter olleyae]